MLKKYIKYFILLLLFIISCLIIYTTNDNDIEITKETILNSIKIKGSNNKIQEDNKIIGSILIEKINVYSNIYDLNSKKNNVEENITILKGSIEPTSSDSIMFLAAHSGNGKYAYFKDLDKLIENDEVILNYKNNKYIYKVKTIFESKKNGSIKVSKLKEKQLVLTTCSPKNKDKQLIINCTLKES